MSALRDKLHALIDDIVDELEARTVQWIDQDRSPLGRDRHLRLARSGTLPSSKEGRRVLIRSTDIDAYLARKSVVKVRADVDEEREVAKVLSMIGRKGR